MYSQFPDAGIRAEVSPMQGGDVVAGQVPARETGAIRQRQQRAQY